MKISKTFRTAIQAHLMLSTIFFASSVLRAAPADAQEHTYNMHLYFSDTQHYEDELTLKFNADGSISGHLHVPNDFDSAIEPQLNTDLSQVNFHITLPAKYDQQFPGGLDYQLRFLTFKPCSPSSFCSDKRDLQTFIGYIVSPRTQRHIGSMVGFSKVKNP